MSMPRTSAVEMSGGWFTKDSDGASSSCDDTSSSVRVCSDRVLDGGDEKTDSGTNGSGLETLLDGGLGVIDNILRRHGALLMYVGGEEMILDLSSENTTFYVT
jgi:hypothetical protein